MTQRLVASVCVSLLLKAPSDEQIYNVMLLKNSEKEYNSFALCSVDISISVQLKSYKFLMSCSSHEFFDNRWRLMSRSTASMEKE